MSITGPALRKALPYLEKMPYGVYFDVGMAGPTLSQIDEKVFLSLQASTLKDVEELKRSLPKGVWKRTWNKYSRNWAYEMDFGEFHVRIYAVEEHPERCEAITEVRKEIKKIPIDWVEEEVETEVIIGWDCGHLESENRKEEVVVSQ